MKPQWIYLLVLAFIHIPIAMAEDSVFAPIVPGAKMNKAEAVFNKGHAALNQGNGPWAEALYRKAIDLNPKEARYHRQLAMVLMKMDRGPEAEREALLATHLDKSDWRSQIMLGGIYHEEKRYEEEADAYRAAIAEIPTGEKDLKQNMEKFLKQNDEMRSRQKELDRKKKEYEDKQFQVNY